MPTPSSLDHCHAMSFCRFPDLNGVQGVAGSNPAVPISHILLTTTNGSLGCRFSRSIVSSVLPDTDPILRRLDPFVDFPSSRSTIIETALLSAATIRNETDRPTKETHHEKDQNLRAHARWTA